MVNWGGGGDRRVIWGHLLQGVAQDVHGGGGIMCLLDNLWVCGCLMADKGLL